MKKKAEANQDFIKDCNSFGVPNTEFRDIFCKRCRNTDCIRAEWATSSWSSRMGSQVDNLLVNPLILREVPSQYADLEKYSFEEISEAAAYRIEESWDDPAEYRDGIEKPSSSKVNQVVEDAVLSLARARGKNVKLSEEVRIEKFNKQTEALMESEIIVPKEAPSDNSERVEERMPEQKPTAEPAPKQAGSENPVPVAQAPASATQNSQQSAISSNKANTDVPEGGIILGDPAQSVSPAEDFDPWAVEEGDDLVDVGATIKMNSGNKNGKD